MLERKIFLFALALLRKVRIIMYKVYYIYGLHIRGGMCNSPFLFLDIWKLDMWLANYYQTCNAQYNFFKPQEIVV